MSEFEEIVDGYFTGVLERNPHVATVLGIHRYDSDIPSGSKSSVEKEIEEAKDTLTRLDGINTIRAELVRSSLEFDVYMMDELRLWESRPHGVEGLVSFIYPLFVRNFAPLDQRLELIADRLEKAPRFMEEVRDRLKSPVDIWVQRELDEVNDLPGFFQLIADEAGNIERQDIAYRINSAAEDLIDELDIYSEWLESTDKKDEWRIGEDSINKLFRKRRLPNSDRIKTEAEDLLKSADDIIDASIAEMDIDSMDEATNTIENNHPVDFDDVLDVYTDEIRNARNKVKIEDIVKVPDNDSFRVSETPDYLSELIGDYGYIEPAPFNQDENAYLYITEPRTAADLKTHNHAEIKNRATSSFYPGTHILRSYCSLNPDKMTELAARFNSFGDDFSNGWELYSEDLMSRYGYSDPGYDLIRARNMVQEASKAIVEIELQRGEMTIRDAVGFLVDEAGVQESHASELVVDYTMNPGQQVSGAIGYILLKDLRNDALDSGYSEGEFHTELMQNGVMPIDLHREFLELV